MRQSFTKENIYKLVSAFSDFEEIDISEEGTAYRVSLYANKKSVVFTWPYELGEVFIDFLDGKTVVFTDWFECLSTDEVGDFVSYIKQVAKRFLYSETRIFRKGFIFKTTQIQYLSANGWLMSCIHSHKPNPSFKRDCFAAP